jgi:hypothetical protein
MKTIADGANMSQKEKIKEMKLALRAGSVVVTPRASGKTEALVEIYHEDNDAAIVLPTEAGYRRFVDLYDKKYGKAPDRRYLMLGGLKYEGDWYTEVELKGKKIYVDELYVNPYCGSFHSAITSYPQPVIVLKDESGAV